MSSQFNYNELMIISKYIESDDYNTFFKTFPKLNLNYHSTFNYITIDENFLTFQIIKKYNNLLKTFPNLNTIIVNINTSKIKTGDNASINILYSIIKLFNIFSNLYPNKFIKINVCDKNIITERFMKNVNKFINYCNKIDKLIKNGNLNKDFKIHIKNYKDEQLKAYNFIVFIKCIESDEINFETLKQNEIYLIKNCEHKVMIKNQNDLNKMYVHEYKNTIFKDLNGETYYYGNSTTYTYIDNIRYFPAYYDLMKSGIKVNNNFNFNFHYIFYYADKLNNSKVELSSDMLTDITYLDEYLFGFYPLNVDMSKVLYKIDKGNSSIYDYIYVVKVLKSMF